MDASDPSDVVVSDVKNAGARVEKLAAIIQQSDDK
jgi:hypothetical protein